MELIRKPSKGNKDIHTNEFYDLVCDIASNIQFEMIGHKIYAIIEGKKYKLIDNVIKFINKHYNVKDYLEYCYDIEYSEENGYCKVYKDKQYLKREYENQCSLTIFILNDTGNTFVDIVVAILDEHINEICDYNSALKVVKNSLEEEVKKEILSDIKCFVIDRLLERDRRIY